MKQLLLSLCISIFVLSTSCNTQKNKKTKDKKDNAKIEEAGMLQFRVHSISDIKATFEMADVVFYNDIINKPTNALNYVGNKKIAANIGVYLGDMLYVMTTSGKREDAYPIYGAIMELAQNVGLTDEFPKLILERYENEGVSADSMLT